MKKSLVCISLISLIYLVNWWTNKNVCDNDPIVVHDTVYQQPSMPQSEFEQHPNQLFLITEDWAQDPVVFIRSRFVEGKHLQYIALKEKDSVEIFAPFKKMSNLEYDHWVNKNVSSYQYVHSIK